MITGNQYAQIVLDVFRLSPKAGYIWGQSGKTWTQTDQDALVKKYNSNPSRYKDYESAVKYGSQWIGHRVWDCSGLTYYAGKKFGIFYHHGSNSSWKFDCQKQGKLTNRMDLPIGAWVYTGTDESKPHIGTYVGNGNVVEAEGTKNGVVMSKLTNKKWKYWGLGKKILFDSVPAATSNSQQNTLMVQSTQSTPSALSVPYPTIKRGSRGDAVKKAQELLAAYGSNLEIDGIFGIGTMSAVKSFQKKHKLAVDGIVGPKTWTELLKIEAQGGN